jgi:hypothetical protein
MLTASQAPPAFEGKSAEGVTFATADSFSVVLMEA